MRNFKNYGEEDIKYFEIVLGCEADVEFAKNVAKEMSRDEKPYDIYRRWSPTLIDYHNGNIKLVDEIFVKVWDRMKIKVKK